MAFPINKWTEHTFVVTSTVYFTIAAVNVRKQVAPSQYEPAGEAEVISVTHAQNPAVHTNWDTTITMRIKPTDIGANKLRYVLISTSLPQPFTTEETIEVSQDGIHYNNKWYELSEISSANTVRTKSMVSEECGINTFSAVVYSEDVGDNPLLTAFGEFYAPVGYDSYVIANAADIRNYTTFAPVELWKDGLLLGKYYLTSIERQSTNWFKLEACSPIGILDKMTHKGGLYVNSTFTAIAQEIIGSAITYSIDPLLASLPINGWLPYGSARENLNQLLFAVGAAATYDSSGNMVFKYNQPDVSVNIPDSNIYVGGSTDYPTKASKVTLIEHAWFFDSTVEADVLFDNTEGTSVSNVLVVFDKPYHSLTGTGLTVTTVNCNCCYVTGTGTLTGKAYYHTQRELVQQDTTLNAEEMRVEDATLVSSLNSLNCLRRVYNYYRNANEVTYGIISDGSYKCGDLISFTDPFGDATTGYVKEMDETVSGVIKSETKIATNWIPKYLGNTYQNYMILKDSDLVNGVWNVPQAMQGNPALIVLFGGFQGGQAGYNGENGEELRGEYQVKNRIASPGQGGQGGQPGGFGRYKTIEYEALASSYNVTFGAGGVGGSTNGALGSLGGDTIFGEYSTEGSPILPGHYVSLIDGTTLTSIGSAGYAGTAGGTAIKWGGGTSQLQLVGGKGQDLPPYVGGNGCAGKIYEDEELPEEQRLYFFSVGSGGGGASVGNNGGNAVLSNVSGGGVGGAGASGASASLCQTGNGGNGGGGGGAGGGVYQRSEFYDTTVWWNHPGNGGAGGQGGTGSPGFAVCYY